MWRATQQQQGPGWTAHYERGICRETDGDDLPGYISVSDNADKLARSGDDQCAVRARGTHLFCRLLDCE